MGGWGVGSREGDREGVMKTRKRVENSESKTTLKAPVSHSLFFFLFLYIFLQPITSPGTSTCGKEQHLAVHFRVASLREKPRVQRDFDKSISPRPVENNFAILSDVEPLKKITSARSSWYDSLRPWWPSQLDIACRISGKTEAEQSGQLGQRLAEELISC